MKKINRVIVALLFAMAILSSCGDSFLEEDLKSKYTPDNALADSLGFEAAIAGLQSAVRAQYTPAELAGTNIQGLLSTMQVGTDVAIIGLLQGIENPYSDYTRMNSQDLAASYYWNWAYTTIHNANQIIERVQDPAVRMTQNNRNAISSEAMFFRAYAYNFLVTLFGEVPLIDKPLQAPRTDFTRASLEELNDLIIADLAFAAANLPAISAVKRAGRINKAAAKHLLAEVYLRIGTVEAAALAEQQCLDIINSPDFNLITTRYGVKAGAPGDPFSDMFIYGNQRWTQGNREAIWVIEQQYNLVGGSNFDGDQHRRVWVPFYANVAGMAIADSLGGRGIGRMRLSNWVLYRLYESGDMRNSKYNIKREFYYNLSTDARYKQKVVPVPADTLSKIAPYTTKWNHMIATDPIGFSAYKDLIMMRLGETYLFLAEAQFRQSKLADAATTVNVLRDRANASDVSAGDITLDFILDERARELLAEENRRMTLVRTKKLVERSTALNALNGGTIKGLEEKHMRLPIPQSEIDLNKDADLGQNDGY